MSHHKSAALIYPMPPDAETLIADKGRPSCFVARSNIPSSARLLRGRSRSRGLSLASAFPTLMRICRGPSPTREPRPIFRQTL
jgi:hypothetical protein